MSELGSLLKKSTVILQDEGTTLGAVPIVNITGAGATASITGAVGTINIPGGGGGGTITVQDEGIDQSTTVTTLNFIGAGVMASGAGAIATINIPGGGAGASWTEIEFDFGTTPKYDAQFTITDAAISGTSKVAVLSSGRVATGRVAGDGQWDSVSYDALAGSGSAIVYAMAHPGPVVGRRYAQYTVA